MVVIVRVAGRFTEGTRVANREHIDQANTGGNDGILDHEGGGKGRDHIEPISCMGDSRGQGKSFQMRGRSI